MFRPDERPASRTGRDRDLVPTASRPGPYESPYDVSRGYPPAEEGGPPRRPVREGEWETRTAG